MEQVLVVAIDKKTKEYKRYDVYTLTDKLTIERIYELADAQNNNDSLDVAFVIYEDPLIIQCLEDCKASFSKRSLVDSLRDICKQIEYSVDSLESWTEDILNELNEDEEE